MQRERKHCVFFFFFYIYFSFKDGATAGSVSEAGTVRNHPIRVVLWAKEDVLRTSCREPPPITLPAFLPLPKGTIVSVQTTAILNVGSVKHISY